MIIDLYSSTSISYPINLLYTLRLCMTGYERVFLSGRVGKKEGFNLRYRKDYVPRLGK